jgi:hypothetical protein
MHRELTIVSGVHFGLLGLWLLDGLEEFGMHTLGARLLDGAEYAGAQLDAVRLLAACSCALGHCVVDITGMGVGAGVAWCWWSCRRVGKSSKFKFSEFWWRRYPN